MVRHELDKLDDYHRYEIEAHNTAAQIFHLRMDGDWRAWSQFNVVYWTWINGARIEEGHSRENWIDIGTLMAAFRRELEEQRKFYDVLVWRRSMEFIEPEKGEYRLSARWHFMSYSMLRRIPPYVMQQDGVLKWEEENLVHERVVRPD